MKKMVLTLMVLILLPLVISQTIYQIDTKIDLKIPFEVNGESADGTATCNVSITYPNSSYLVHNGNATNQNNGEFNYTILKTSVIEYGTYTWNAFCCEGTKCASGYGEFEVTKTGKKVSLSNTILVIAFLVVGVLLFIFGNSLDNEKYLLKTGIFLFSLLLGLLAINTAGIIASESVSLSLMHTSGLILTIAVISIIFLYVFITWTIQTFKQVKNKKEIQWRY